MPKFEDATASVKSFLMLNATENDYMHALNAHEWLIYLAPASSEILQLAALCHDLERARPKPYKTTDFETYDEYKRTHAQLSGEIASNILATIGYHSEQLQRLREIILNAEFPSDDSEVQLLCDADSISYFDNNIEDYLRRKGIACTQEKMKFMFERSSPRAKRQILRLLKTKHGLPEFIKS